MNNLKISKSVAIAIGIIVSVLIVIVGFTLLQGVFTRASDLEPRDVQITDKTENSARIVWTTGVESEGIVQYGVSPTALTSFGQPEAQKTTNHSVVLSLLSPGTTYYFQISSGGKVYNNGGVPWTFTTLEKQESQPAVSPTSAVTAPTATPAPASSCEEAQGSDCEKIKDKLGKGCSTQDYFRCVRKLTPTP